MNLTKWNRRKAHFCFFSRLKNENKEHNGCYPSFGTWHTAATTPTAPTRNRSRNQRPAYFMFFAQILRYIRVCPKYIFSQFLGSASFVFSFFFSFSFFLFFYFHFFSFLLFSFPFPFPLRFFFSSFILFYYLSLLLFCFVFPIDFSLTCVCVVIDTTCIFFLQNIYQVRGTW